jgi:DNA-binding LacI/PurR family transcriptional regulator
MMISETQPVRSHPKLDETYSRLVSMTAAMEPGTRLPKVTDLCRDLDVSMVTLGKALARLEAEGVLNRKHGLGIFTNRLYKHSIYVICDPALFRTVDSSPMWSMLLDHLKVRAEAADEKLSLRFAGLGSGPGVHLDLRLKQEIRQREMDGVILLGLNDQTTQWIIDQDVKNVGYGSKAQFRVRNDHFAQVTAGVEVLAKADCKRIAYWGTIAPWRVEDVIIAGQEREKLPFKAALDLHQLEYFPELFESGIDQANEKTNMVEASLREQGFRLATRVFSQPRELWPDGIVTGNDVGTLGALVAMSKLGVRVGRDVLVATHANTGSSVLHGYEDELAIISFAPDKFVRALFGLIEQLIEGKTPTEHIVYVEPEAPVLGKFWNCKT